MHQRIASGSHIIVGSTLIFSSSRLITVTRILIMIGPGLIGITARLIPIGEREIAPTTGFAVTLVRGFSVIT